MRGYAGMVMERRHQFALYRAMLLARRIDEAEQRLAREGAVFFHIPGAGHEGSCALAPHLTSDDWLHCHYRQKALLVARGVKAHDYLAALFCNDDSPSRGRQMLSLIHILTTPRRRVIVAEERREVIVRFDATRYEQRLLAIVTMEPIV